MIIDMKRPVNKGPKRNWSKGKERGPIRYSSRASLVFVPSNYAWSSPQNSGPAIAKLVFIRLVETVRLEESCSIDPLGVIQHLF